MADIQANLYDVYLMQPGVSASLWLPNPKGMGGDISMYRSAAGLVLPTRQESPGCRILRLIWRAGMGQL